MDSLVVVRLTRRRYRPFPRRSRSLLRGTVLALALLALAVADAPHVDDARPRALVLDLTGDAVSEETRKAITGLVVVKLTKDPRLDVVSGQEIKGMANLAADKQAAGCDDACLAEIAGAMDARLIVSGFVGKLGSLTVVNLSLFDATKARAVGRSTIEAESIEEVSGKLDKALNEMLAALPKHKPPRAAADAGPGAVTMGLVGGGAGGVVLGGVCAGIAFALANDATSARTALDDTSDSFRAGDDVDDLSDAHDAYVDKRDTYNAFGPALAWSGAALAVAGVAASAVGAVLWVSE